MKREKRVNAKTTVGSRKLPRWTRNLLVSYLLILIVPLIFCAYAYTKAISSLNDSAATYHLSMLDQAKSSLETQILEAQLTAMQIMDDSSVNSLLYAVENGNETAYKIWECQQKLAEYTGTNKYISQAYICIKKGYSTISTSHYYGKNGSSQEFIVDGSANITVSPLFEYSRGKTIPVQIRDDKINEKRTIMYTHTFPDGIVDSAYGNVCIVFNQQMVEKLLTFTNQWYGGYNLILNENNQILSYTGDSIEEVSELWVDSRKMQNNYTIDRNGEKMSVTYLRSAENGWTYISVYPQKQVLLEANNIRSILWLYIALSVTVGVLLSIFFAMYNTRPVQRIIKYLGGAGEITDISREDEFGTIQRVLGNLIDEKHLLTQKADDRRDMVKEALFKVILSGRLSDMSLIENMSKEAGISLKDCSFIGVNFDFEHMTLQTSSLSAEGGDTVTGYICGLLDYRFRHNGCYHYMPENQTFALLCFPKDNLTGVYDSIQSIIKDVENAVSVIGREDAKSYGVVVGISNFHCELEAAYLCNEEALFATEYSKLFEFGRPVFYNMINEKINPCKFTLNDHQCLLNILKSGDADGAQKIFNEIISRNMVENRLGADMIEQFFYAIKGVLLEGIDFAGSDEIKAKLSQLDFQESELFLSFMSLEEAYIAITAAIGEKRNKKGSLLVNNISEYLSSDFSDSNITVISASEKFGISEAYLSKLFREFAGTSFAAYLEKLRIDAAKSLLINDKLKMQQISEQVGYNSVESFRRAFKRLTGVAPSEYKESMK